jgi:hypothetical protein
MRRRDLFWGVATLVAVEPDSWAVLACAKTGDRSGPAWQAVLRPFADLEFVVADAGKGIAGGVAAVSAARREASAAAGPVRHGLDVFHTAQEARRVLAGPWRQAESAWQAAEAADQRVDEARRRGRNALRPAAAARAAWNVATHRLAEVERLQSAWERARAALAVFRPDGTLNDRSWAESEIRTASADLAGPEWKKVRAALTDPRALAFLDRLHRRLAAAEPDERSRAAYVHRWRLRHQPPPAAEPATAADQALELLDAVIRERPLPAAEQAAYERVSAVLRTTVRASSAVEGVNSVLQMQQGRHRRMTQGLLDLKRLYWNCRRRTTGRRRGQSPYERLGVPLPSTNFWQLLHGPPAEQAEHVST